MEDKTFELVTILYNEFHKFLKTRFVRLESEVASIAKSQLCLENDLKPKVEALLDGYKLMYEKLQVHDRRFDEVDRKFEEHDKRFDRIDKKFEEHDRRFDEIDKKLQEHDRRFDEIDKRIIRVEKQVIKRLVDVN